MWTEGRGPNPSVNFYNFIWEAVRKSVRSKQGTSSGVKCRHLINQSWERVPIEQQLAKWQTDCLAVQDSIVSLLDEQCFHFCICFCFWQHKLWLCCPNIERTFKDFTLMDWLGPMLTLLLMYIPYSLLGTLSICVFFCPASTNIL